MLSIIITTAGVFSFGSILVLLDHMLRDLQTPMKKRLPYHRRDLRVPSACPGGQYLVAKLTPKAALGTRALEPPADLSRVVAAPPSLVKAAVPLKPPIRIRIGDPS